MALRVIPPLPSDLVPFVITNGRNLPALNCKPLGRAIPKEQRYEATRLRSAPVIDALHHLDEAAFGGQEMPMPRWVMFDCGEFPGIVAGFGRLASKVPAYARERLGIAGRSRSAFVPLSMWVALRCVEDGCWFGHNLSSANVLLASPDRIPGLGFWTKAMGVALARAKMLYGATQWSSPSVEVHLRFGAMDLLSAFTPAHSHPETLVYRITLGRPPPRPKEGDRLFVPDDGAKLKRLHRAIEKGQRWSIVGWERKNGMARFRLRESLLTPARGTARRTR